MRIISFSRISFPFMTTHVNFGVPQHGFYFMSMTSLLAYAAFRNNKWIIILMEIPLNSPSRKISSENSVALGSLTMFEIPCGSNSLKQFPFQTIIVILRVCQHPELYDGILVNRVNRNRTGSSKPKAIK